MQGMLADFVKIRGRFHRSVNLNADWGDRRSLGEFIPTTTIVALAEQICSEALAPDGARTWSLTGPYGAGKSAFALFLADILANRRSRHPESARIRESLGLGSREFLPVLVTAERGGLGDVLRTALGESRRKLLGPTRGRPTTSLVSSTSQLAAEAKRRRKAGLLVIVDELGKFLEFAALRPNEGDVYLLQQLAEAASRSAIPVVFLTILHSGFADYLPAGEEVRRNEWQKVQGRFHDVPYQLPADQVLELIGAALAVDPPLRLRRGWSRVIRSALDSISFREPTYREALTRTADLCAPLHPVALALLWPLFRSKGAQNERSLFSFLTSDEPFGFHSFVENISADEEGAPLYRAPQLYDYITHALGIGAFRGEKARRWAQIDQALARIPSDAPAGAPDIVKTIGLLDILGGQVGLRADSGTISEAVDPRIDAKGVLQYLEDRSIVLFRRHLDAFALWEGSDFDIESALQVAKVQTRKAGSPALELRNLFPPRPLVVQRHYLRTGTMRYLDVEFVDESTEAQDSVLETSISGDGRIQFLLPRAGQLQLMRELREAPRFDTDGRPVVTVIPNDLSLIAEDLLEVQAWEYVAHHSPELVADQAARQEVRSQLQSSRERLARKVGPLIGLPGHAFDPTLARWSHGPEVFHGSTPGKLKEWLAGIMDETYRDAPVLKNELLNRNTMSSAASKARRNLLEAMLTSGAQERLGFSGYPPERSMYEAMLFAGGLHQPKKSSWRFNAPEGTWAAAHDCIDRFVGEATAGRREVVQLYEALRRPPIGLREGPLPVLFLSYLLGKEDEVALYEEGVLVPELRIEVIERLLRRPELFEVRSHRLSPEQARALTLLTDLARGGSTPSPILRPEKALLPVVRALVGFVSTLPPFVKQTRRLDPADTIAVRDLLLSATDPSRLLFADLPGALGIDQLDKGSSPVFAERLRDRLRVLGRAYPGLLDEIEQQIRVVFRLSGTAEAAYHQLQQKARAIQGVVADQRLRTFVLEAGRDLGARDWREGLARALKDGFPPSHWKDHDIAVFQIRLREVASDFLRLEELVQEQGRPGTRRILRIGMIDETGCELRRVIPIQEEDDQDVLRLVLELGAVLRRGGDGSGDYAVSQLEALARVAVDIMREQQELSPEVP
jgi:hypothetical protein